MGADKVRHLAWRASLRKETIERSFGTARTRRRCFASWHQDSVRIASSSLAIGLTRLRLTCRIVGLRRKVLRLLGLSGLRNLSLRRRRYRSCRNWYGSRRGRPRIRRRRGHRQRVDEQGDDRRARWVRARHDVRQQHVESGDIGQGGPSGCRCRCRESERYTRRLWPGEAGQSFRTGRRTDGESGGCALKRPGTLQRTGALKWPGSLQWCRPLQWAGSLQWTRALQRPGCLQRAAALLGTGCRQRSSRLFRPCCLLWARRGLWRCRRRRSGCRLQLSLLRRRNSCQSRRRCDRGVGTAQSRACKHRTDRGRRWPASTGSGRAITLTAR